MTSPTSLLGIFLLLSLSQKVSADFNLTFYLSCKECHTNWCANVFVYEHDDITKHDFLAEKEICAPRDDKHANVTLDFGYIDAEGDTSLSYEIMPLISHNCSSTGEFYCAKPAEPYEVSAMRFNLIYLSVALSELEDSKGKCVHPETSPI